MIKKIQRSKVVSVTFLAALLLVLGGAIWSRWVLRGIVASAPLILHFDDLSGITAVGTPLVLQFMAVFGVIVVAMNFFIALELDARDRFLGKFAAALTLFFALLLFIAFAAIVNVN